MPEYNFIIRRMLPEDIDGVYEVESACFATPWTKDSICNDVANNPCARYLVAESDGCIVAYAGIWIILDEGHVTNIAVLEQYRGYHLGKALFAALMRYASNLGVIYVTLEVRKSNITAQNLYKHFDFVTVNIRKKYYEDNGEDACLMVCDKMPPIDPNFDDTDYRQSHSITVL